jgi:hypothetical protein
MVRRSPCVSGENAHCLLLDTCSAHIVPNVDAIALPRSNASLTAKNHFLQCQYGRPDAPVEQAHQAIAMAQLDGLIASLPKGLDTGVGERGLKVSQVGFCGIFSCARASTWEIDVFHKRCPLCVPSDLLQPNLV